MPETIEQCCSVPKWHWYNIMSDLDVQGGLPGVVIDPLSVEECGCGGTTTAGTKFYITWVKDKFLLLSVSQQEQALVDAFAKVVGYQPFCRYISTKGGLLTIEWDKQDPTGRYSELETEGVKDLQCL